MLDRIGAVGLGFIVASLMMGWLVPRYIYNEMKALRDAASLRAEKAEEKLLAALEAGKRSVEVANTVTRVLEQKDRS